MPVEFLFDREVAAYGRYACAPSPAELNRFFFLDDADKALVRRRRGDHHRIGFALQLTTVRFVGMFLPDPLDVPDEVVIYLAKQLDIDTIEQLSRYTERRSTRFEHQDEIRAALGLTEFSAQVEGFTAWLEGLAYTTGDGPHALFAASVDYLRVHRVLLPGVSTLARLVAKVRAEAMDRLHRTLCEELTSAECARLDELLVAGDGVRVCELERWRKGVSVPSGKNLEKALKRAGEITESRHQRQVMMMSLPRDLIDPDLHQPGQPCRTQLIGGHPLRDRPHRTPGDPQELTDRLLIRLRDQPRHHLLEIPGEPRPHPRTGHSLGHHPVLRAPQPPPPQADPAHPTPQIQVPPGRVHLSRVTAMPAPELTMRAHQQPPGQTKPDTHLTTTRVHLPRSGIHRCRPWQVQQLVQYDRSAHGQLQDRCV
ncbi:MAG: DUF4158 domain-containing protein [Pseudonocardiales bacterium]|nr:DUF4158 domain-containing protein [Pseudonocardiales bacterium]